MPTREKLVSYYNLLLRMFDSVEDRQAKDAAEIPPCFAAMEHSIFVVMRCVNASGIFWGCHC